MTEQQLAQQAVSKGYVRSVDEYMAAVSAGKSGAQHGYTQKGTTAQPNLVANTAPVTPPTPTITSSSDPIVTNNKKKGVQSGADNLAGAFGNDPVATWYQQFTDKQTKDYTSYADSLKDLVGRKTDLALARSNQQYSSLMQRLDKEYKTSIDVAKAQAAAINPYGSQSTSEMQYADTLSKNYTDAAEDLTNQARMAQEALELGEMEAYIQIQKGMQDSYNQMTQNLYSALTDLSAQKTQAEQFSLNQEAKAVDDYRQSFSYAGLPTAQELQNMTVDELMSLSQVQFGLKAGLDIQTIIGDISRGSFKQQQVDMSAARTEAYLANIASLVGNRGADGYGGGLDSKESTMFNSLVDKYNKSPLVAANDKAQVLRDVTSALKQNPNDSALQLSFIYGFVKALDSYDSAVREGEISLIKETQGVKDKIQNLIPKLERGSIINPESVTRYINTAELLTNSLQTSASAKKQQFSNQARIANKNVGKAFEEYIGGGQSNNPIGI